MKNRKGNRRYDAGGGGMSIGAMNRNKPWSLQEIIDNLEPITESGCLVWSGHIDHNGYGLIRYEGRSRRIHRILYEALKGPIPAGMVPDHLCRVRLCGNIHHLEAVTEKENTLRGIGPTAMNARKQVCKHGHSFTHENTRIRSDGKQRECLMCKRILEERRSKTRIR